MGEQHYVPEPVEVFNLVEQYVTSALRNAADYSNSEPLDEDGVYGLHRLAARIYAMGHHDAHLMDGGWPSLSDRLRAELAAKSAPAPVRAETNHAEEEH